MSTTFCWSGSSIPDIQSAWAMLLHCANARANCALRGIRPDLARHFEQAHDAGMWRCLCAILRVGEDQCDAHGKDTASFLLSMGGLGCAAPCARATVHIGRDSLPMVRERHPGVEDMILDALESDPATPILSAVVEAARAVQVGNFEPPSWTFHGARPPPQDRKSLRQGAPAEGGNTKQLPAPKRSAKRGSCPDSQTTSGQCCVPRAAQDLVWHCRPFPPALLSESIPITSGEHLGREREKSGKLCASTPLNFHSHGPHCFLSEIQAKLA